MLFFVPLFSFLSLLVARMVAVSLNCSLSASAYHCSLLFLFLRAPCLVDCCPWLALVYVSVTTVSFVVGAFTSILCGYLGMKIAVHSNVRTCHESWIELGSGFSVALKAGSVMGFALVSFGLASCVAMILLYRLPMIFGEEAEKQKALFEALAGALVSSPSRLFPVRFSPLSLSLFYSICLFLHPSQLPYLSPPLLIRVCRCFCTQDMAWAAPL